MFLFGVLEEIVCGSLGFGCSANGRVLFQNRPGFGGLQAMNQARPSFPFSLWRVRHRGKAGRGGIASPVGSRGTPRRAKISRRGSQGIYHSLSSVTEVGSDLGSRVPNRLCLCQDSDAEFLYEIRSCPSPRRENCGKLSLSIRSSC